MNTTKAKQTEYQLNKTTLTSFIYKYGVILFLLFGLGFSSGAQNAAWNYTTSEGSLGTTYSWIDCSGGSTVVNGDDNEASFNWPFTFSFYDDTYTISDEISASSNGFIRFNGTANTSANTANNYNLSNGNTNLGQIIALAVVDGKVGDDNGYAKYLVTGTAPNRILTIEYKHFEIDWNDDDYADVQVSLYETSNKIVLKFGTENINNNGVDMGICSGVTNFYAYWNQVNGMSNNTWIEYTPAGSPLQAGDFRTRRDGNWNRTDMWQKYNGSSWQNTTEYPGQNSGTGRVTIENGDIVDLNISPANSIGSIYIQYGGNDSYINFNGSNALTVTGEILLSSNSNNDEKAIRVDNGTLTAGSVIANSNGNTRDAYIRIDDGTVNITNDITLNSTGRRTYILFTGDGTLNLAGNISGGIITSTTGGDNTNPPTSGTVNYNGSSDQDVEAYTYYNLDLSGTGPFNNKGSIIIENDFSANGTISTSSNVTFNGTTACGGTMAASGGTVEYTETALNVLEGTYSTLLKNGSSTDPSTLCGAVTINTNLDLDDGIINIGDYDLTLNDGATITESTAFGISNMIRTSGTGYLVKNSTTVAGFEILYPIGSIDYYNYMDLRNGLTATATGTASIKVRTVSGGQGPDFLEKYWEVVSTDLSSISNVHILFDYNNAEVDGIQGNYNPYVDPNGSGWVIPSNPTGTGIKPFGSTNSSALDGKWTAGETPPVTPKTWYAYSTLKNWSDPAAWTLDGATTPTYVNPDLDVPASTDIVIIPSGKKVTIQAGNDNLQTIQIEVNGDLDLTTSTGHNFGTIKGNGTILMPGSTGVDNFPAGTTTSFADATNGGTVKITGTGVSLNTNRTFNNLTIDLTSGSATLLADYTLNGKLTVTTGDFKINDDTDNVPLNLSVGGDVFVGTNGTITVGSGDPNGSDAGYGNYHKFFHVFTVSGDFTNQGSVRFTNQLTTSGPDYNTRTSGGAVSLVFDNLSNNTLDCQGTTDLYYLVLNKGNNQTYSLTVTANDKANFSLFGDNNQDWDDTDQENPENRKALWIKAGSLILEGYVTIPTLTEGTRDYTIGANAALVLNSKDVFVSTTTLSGAIGMHSAIDFNGLSYSSASGIDNGSGSQGIYVNGTLQINDGTFETNYSHGIVYRQESTANKLEINGGTVTTGQFRISGSAAAATAKMSYVQTGGDLYLVDNRDNAAIFDLSAGLGSFTMSGGTITLQDLSSSGTNAIEIACAENNINVTGGTIILDNTAGTNTIATISTTAPFHNFILRENQGKGVLLQTALTLNNDLQIETENFDANNLDVTIGSDLNITAGATYTPGTNTTTFDGAKRSNLYLPALQTFNNLTIAKTDKDKDLTIASGLATAFEVSGAFRLENGFFDYNTYTAELNGSVYIADTAGIHTSSGKLYLNGGSAQTITSNNGYIQNLEIDNANGISISGDLNITGTLTLTDGIFDIASDKLTMLGANATFAGTFGVGEMIQTAGNSSDGGIEMYVDANETLTFPLGTNANASIRYTPVVASFTGYNDNGYVQIRPSDNILETTNNSGANNDILSYYWRVSVDSFTTTPSVQYTFTYDSSDDDSGNDNLFIPGKVIDDSPYTRTPLGVDTDVDDTATPPTITFAAGTLENANYTAGEANRFSGTIKIYYTRDIGQSPSWTNGNAWTRNDILNASYENHDSRQSAAGDYPKNGDVAVIGWVPWGNTTSSGNEGEPHIIWINNTIEECAELVFEQMLDIAGDSTARVYRTNFAFRPTLCLDGNSPQLTAGLVRGEGLFWNRQSDPDFSLMDIGEYAQEDSSYILYENFANPRTLSNTPDELPNLMVANNDWGKNDYDITFTKDITTNGNLELMGDVNIILNNGITGDINVGRDIIMFEETANNSGGGAEIVFQNNGTARTLTVNGDINLLSTDNESTNGGMITINNANAPATEHNLILYGDVNQTTGNSGTSGLQLWTNTNSDCINLYLKGETTNFFNRTSGSIPNFNKLILDKGENQTNSFQFNTDFNLNASTNGASKALELLNGTLILNDASINIDLTTGGDDFSIPSTANLTITQGTANATGTETGIALDGTLKINGGTLDMSTTENNYIEYGASGNATIDVSAGTLNVATQIRRLTTSTSGVLNYIQSGGTVLIGTNTDANDYVESRGMLEVVNNGSNFTLSGGGSLTFVRQNGASPEIAALYLHPDTYDVSNSIINIGNSNTPGGQNDFGINSSIALNDVVVYDNVGSVNLATLPLTISGDLTINMGGTFDAKGLDLTLSNNLINNGTYSASNNTLIFSSNTAQTISGSGTEDIYNFTKTGTGTLTLSKGLQVNSLLDINNGTIATDSYTLNSKGHVIIDGSIESASGNGLEFSGTELQNLSRSSVGTSTLGIITINNSNGVKVANTSHWFSISERLHLQNGVFNIGGALLEFGTAATVEDASGSGFSSSNMIQTNSSFQDNGVKKNFSAHYGLGAGNNDFIFPIGQLKYTPVTFDFTSDDTFEIGSTTGSLTVRPANEYHPTIDDGTDALTSGDVNNVLQYYWILRANNITDMISAATLEYEASDALADEVEVPTDLTEANYITARIRTYNNATGTIDKNSGIVDDTNHDLTFTFNTVSDNDISGDYFAGIDAAIPANVSTYNTDGLGIGNIDVDNTFTEAFPYVGYIPTGAILVVKSGDELVFNVDDVSLYKTEIQAGGTLTIAATERHRLGIVTGEGDLKIESSTSDISFPAGDYIDFFNCTGGGLNYAGTGNYNVMSSLPSVRNLTIGGGGTKTLANNDIVVCEDFTVEGATTFNNSSNNDISINNELIVSGGEFKSGTNNNIIVTNGVIINGGNYNGETGGNDTFGSLTINHASSVFNVGSGGNISIQGDITFTDGTFNGGSGSSSIILNGSSTQTLTGDFSGTSHMHNLQINNSTGILLAGDVTIDNTLTLSSGLVTPSSNALLINSDATISPSTGTSSSYINGKLSKVLASGGDNFIFPVGKSGNWGYAGVHNVTTGGLTWDVEYFHSAATGEGLVDNFTAESTTITSVSESEYWKITDNGSSNATISLSWNSNSNISDNQTEREKLEVMVWNDGNSEWDNFGGGSFSGSHTQTTGSFYSTSAIGFSENIITLGSSDENNPLPIELISFTATADNNSIELNWATATELNNDYFDIERSDDGINFEVISVLTGAGNSSSRIDYSETDYNPMYGTSYYRIKQTDFDGKYSFSPVVSVSWNSNSDVSYSELKVYPNPYKNGDLTLSTESIKPYTNINLSIFNLNGKMVLDVHLVNPSNQKINLIPMAIEELPKGMYIVSVVSGSNVSRAKVIVE